ncbi:3-oxoacyl-(acyl carrier protein) synthase [Enhygromyxa salina]|uniref:3-oxoacyl-(Acyl carrier protein) synthase n=1 Tax=Enhygromyxa salina TaxID=215803 RepID=A0A2S9XKK1_9BACT|nr:hypothetical protein [Enhygromyxa salina]PRP93201.1 3-oxoacyl-(acyl carrier protein) synthase [Enhygromyxa salina]
MTRCQVRNTGLVCPVGLTGPTACAAICCEITKIEELEIDDEHGEPYYASAMAELDPGLSGRQRVLGLLARTLDQAVAPLRYEHPVALFIALPEIFAGADLSGSLRALVERFESPVALDLSRVLVGGPVTAFNALALAQETLATGRVAACVVAASD